jgi:hypothetical protein
LVGNKGGELATAVDAAISESWAVQAAETGGSGEGEAVATLVKVTRRNVSREATAVL